MTLKLGFLASGNGSSAEAIVDAIAAGALAAEARLIVSNKRGCAAFEWAAAKGVPTLAIPTISDPDAADAALAQAMADHGVELIVMSGYLRRLGPRTLARYAGRIVNIHPGPLPRFGGQAMTAAIPVNAAESAIVIHVVDEEYDHGPEVHRRAVPLVAGDTAETLEARVKALEPEVFVETLQRLASGQLSLP